MEKKNYQIILDNTLKEIESSNTRPRLLLHSCCAPCSSYVLEYISSYFDITILYYNPNISPKEEFLHRANELERLIGEMHLPGNVEFISGKYDPESFFEMAKGHEAEPEGGERCKKCYRLRMKEAAEFAAKRAFDYFTTTLSISPHKDAQALNLIGRELSEIYGVKYLYSDFKKRDGYRRSCELSAQYGLYRQDFCGCPFSRLEAEGRRQK